MIQGKQLKALLRTLRDQGVVSFEHDGVKILLDPHFKADSGVKAEKKAPPQAEPETSLIPLPDMSDEHWLLATNLQDPDESQSN